jgi:hypothetical protein
MADAMRRRETFYRVAWLAVVLFLVIVFFVPSSLAKQPQIQNKLLVTAIGLDETEDGVKLSCVAVMPTGKPDSSVTSLVVSHEGATIGECVSAISSIYGKDAELGLCGFVLLGDSVKGDVTEHLGYLLSSARISPGTYLAVTDGADAEKILSLAAREHPSTAGIFSSIVEYNAKSADITTRTLLEFISAKHSPSALSVLPCVRLDEQKAAKAEQEVKEKSGESVGEMPVEDLTDSRIFINGRRAFDLSSDETVALNLTSRDLTDGLTALEKTVIDGEEIERTVSRIYSTSRQRRVFYDEDVPKVKIALKVKLELTDHRPTLRFAKKVGIDEHDAVSKLASKYAEKFKRDLESLSVKSKSENADIFLVSNDFYRFYPSRFNEDEQKGDFLSRLTYEFDVQVEFK